MTEGIICHAKYPWVKRIVLPYVVVFTFISLIAGFDYFLIAVVLLIFSAHYLFFQQYHFTDYLLTGKKLIIHFPVSFIKKTKTFTLSEIEKIEFNFHPPLYGSPYCIVKCVDGNEDKVFCSGRMDMNGVIEGLQKMNVQIYC